ncbi:hypothetical protein STEG23_024187, partial [Scotinomys teguina]
CKRLHQELQRLKEQKQTSANNTRHPTAENNQERALKVWLRSFSGIPLTVYKLLMYIRSQFLTTSMATRRQAPSPLSRLLAESVNVTSDVMVLYLCTALVMSLFN